MKREQLYKERIEKYNSFIKKNGKKPTAIEFGKITGLSGPAARLYARYHEIDLDTTFYVTADRREKYDALFMKRKALYEELCEELDRIPTIGELAKKWGTTKDTAALYKNFRRRNYGDEDFKTMRPSLLRENQLELTIRNVIQEIYDKHKILPSISELALLYGVTRQRVEQVTKKNGIEVRDGHRTIDWKVDVEKWKK